MIETITIKDIVKVFIIIIVYFFGLYIGLTSIDLEKEEQKNYIQNLEEKVNILTLDYEKFALEDSLKQEV